MMERFGRSETPAATNGWKPNSNGRLNNSVINSYPWKKNRPHKSLTRYVPRRSSSKVRVPIVRAS